MAYIERKYLTEQFEDLLHDDNIMTPVVKVLDALKIIDTAPTWTEKRLRNNGKIIF